jgi:hypothetical protein
VIHSFRKPFLITRYAKAAIALFACSSVAAIVDAPKASAMLSIDNIGANGFPSVTTNWVAKTFSTPIDLPTTLSGAKLALATNNTGVNGVTRSIQIDLYTATNSGAPGINGGVGYRPFGPSLASTSYSANFNTSGDVTQAPGTGGFSTLGTSQLGALSNFVLQPNTNYALVFSSSTGINWRSLGAYTATGLTYLNSTGTQTGTGLSPITITGNWQSPTQARSQFNAMTLTFTQVPAPALAGLPSIVGMASFSRRLRRRIHSAAG